MKMTVSSNQFVDKIVAEFDWYESNMRKVPRGYLSDDAPYMANYREANQTLEKISAIGEAFGISGAALYYIGRVARRWYRRTNWQFCLSEAAADGLVEYALNNYQTGHWDTCRVARRDCALYDVCGMY